MRVVLDSERRRSAEIRLRLAPSALPRVVELETGPLRGSLDHASAIAARDRFVRFQSVQTETAHDATFSLPGLLKALLLIGGVVLASIAARLHEQIRQLRPVRIVVDHEREVVVIGKRTVPFVEVRDVIVEQGVIRAISNRKGGRPLATRSP